MTRIKLAMYTTKYREGGDKFEKAAKTKYLSWGPADRSETRIVNVESKKDFLRTFDELIQQNIMIDEFHFFGHSGMYGIMFGTRQWPEQFSPFEWKTMDLPLDSTSKLYFHACRSGRWFAPFIARTLNVRAYGYHNYTTVSLSPDRFVWEGFGGRDSKLYIIACPGMKSDGPLASIKKYSMLMKADEMAEYLPPSEIIDTTYDSVAELYENTFEDIVVRSDELNWLEERIEKIKPGRVLDIGCGNGAFLNSLSKHFDQGVGVDLSAGMLNQARVKRKANTKLSFEKINGPELPFEDNQFDLVISTLAFRYLDWDPCMSEIVRVLKPGGHFLVVDMVTAPVKVAEMGLFAKSKLKVMLQRMLYPQYYAALRKLVHSKGWQKMLQYNPIRSEHEMRWYLESRFEGAKAEVINVGWRSRMLAFDSGQLENKNLDKLTYP